MRRFACLGASRALVMKVKVKVLHCRQPRTVNLISIIKMVMHTTPYNAVTQRRLVRVRLLQSILASCMSSSIVARQKRSVQFHFL